eukprot:CAMPEP_0168574620 /NCGR_PEP_ID=MMETSP0413-20121227/19191_1 /TAXON_ID=136452 /ORGANISM="Filamoeba nolandi, Strain NC-AS-23-1" /LENGTH=135 /DNA_ID=CAMNT_0008608001 /DNA_START=355 /DNA_END=762 /DNA_ORIENTATION=+
MADVSDSAIQEAYNDVRSDSTETNWLLIGYQDNKTLKLVGKGSGGINELTQHLADNGCFYGYLRVVNKDEETTRTKFVFISWKGDNAPVLRKGKMSVHISDVKKIIKDYAFEIGTSDLSDLSEDAINKRVKAVNY